MKKIVMLAILSVLVMAMPCFAFVTPIDYKGVGIKFYNEKTNQTECFKQLDKIPEKYLIGLKYISVYKEQDYFFDLVCEDSCSVSLQGGIAGKYFWFDQRIALLRGCSNDEFDTIVHEIAHHVSWKEHGDLQDNYNHIGSFKEAYEKIWSEIN